MSVLGQLQRVGIEVYNDGRLVPKIFGAKSKAISGIAATAKALPTGYGIVALTTVGSDGNFTLANGKAGTRIYIYLATDGGDATIVPATFVNGTSITLDNAGDGVELLSLGSSGWIVSAGYGAVVA